MQVCGATHAMLTEVWALLATPDRVRDLVHEQSTDELAGCSSRQTKIPFHHIALLDVT